MNRPRPPARRPITALLTAAFLAAPFAFAPAPARAADPIVMKMSTATLNDMQHEFMKRFGAMVEKDSKGRIKPEIYTASQLGSIPRQIEATQFGSVQVFVGPPEFLSGVDPRYEVLSAPLVLGDMKHAMKVLEDKEFSSQFLALGANKGLRGLALFVHGPAEFDLRKQVKTIDDLKGMKLRVLAAPLQLEQVARLGATAVPMSLDQVLPALQQGAIDGLMSDLAVFSSLRYADAAKYVLQTDHAIVTSIAVVSKTWFDGLPPDLQKIVSEDGAKTAHDLLPWILEFNDNQKKIWQQAGGVLVPLSPAERKEFDAKMAGISADVLKDKPDIKKMYDVMADASKRAK